ncbi:NADH-quinone oxidoreductase subunit J [Candidatus Profftia lariciata]|uniref:NADH-quinone oxidoreductase subunit J n=1 Tax=Candidatus Profftia lariciata TaxID=1987921 RepID=UPI001D035DA5|nr:NADH-quinone oxidoreductase subunit J [Candidatus Profftia lariciata]UDG81654.1 NADH-quinone oxidoreductase subunit J [Candidatus Profftia lariciata]
MEFIFYIAALIAVAATFCVILHTNAIHALLYLITSFLAVAMVFFSLGAYFAGVFEIIIYAGAIMVLFVFVVMMLNLGKTSIKQEYIWLKFSLCIWPSILSFILLILLIYVMISLKDQSISGDIIDIKAVGISLFDSYILAVELMSVLLLAGLVVAFHIGHVYKREFFYKSIEGYTNKSPVITVKHAKAEDSI